MLSSSFLDVAIGIVFVFLLLSLIASTINEIILSFFNMRGRTLLDGIKNLLDDPKAEGLVKEIYNQGQVYGLFKGTFNPGETWKVALPLFGKKDPKLGKYTRSNLPSYIPTTNFVMAFLGALPNAAKTASELAVSQEAEAKKRLDDAQADADKNPSDTTKKAALDAAQAAYAKAQEITKNAQDGAAKVASALEAAQTAQASFKGAISSGSSTAQQIAATPVELVTAFQSLKAVAEALSNNPATVKVGKPLLAMITTANNDFDKLKTSIADWYNSAMDRASGWYKYNTQKMLFSIGIVLAIALNANTIVIVQQLSKNPTLREAIVAAAATEAAKAKENPPTPSPGTKDDPSPFHKVQTQVEQLDELGIPLGWPARDGESWWGRNNDALQRPGTWVGWLFTAVAISLGAPFWFDMLNKIMIVRSTVKPGEKSPPAKDKEKK